MKKIRFDYELYKETLKTQNYILMFVFSLIIALYGVFQFAFKYDYISGFIYVLSAKYYVIGLGLILLIDVYNIYSIYNRNLLYIGRLNYRKNYLKNLIRCVLVSNFFNITLNLILVIIGLNIFNHNDFSVFVKNGQVLGILYLLYCIFKIYILYFFISVINVLLLRLIHNYLVPVINILFYFILNNSVFEIVYSVKSILQIPLFIDSYFFSYFVMYNSFFDEILYFLIYCGMLYGLTKGLFILALYVEKRKDI